MGDVYPELRRKAAEIREITEAEERRFLETIEGGLRRLEEIFASGAKAIPGEEAFKLYDTFGFPIDLTQIIAGERGVEVDLAGFEQALEGQRHRSRTARASGQAAVQAREAPQCIVPTPGKWRSVKRGKQKFVGYQKTEADTDVLAFRQEGPRVELVLKENPFYVESGGQVSDTGAVGGEGWSLAIDSVRKDSKGTVVGGTFSQEFEPTSLHAAVDAPRRQDIERNHSATHLVHYVLRKRLGTHVRQQGSLVQPERLRFDFSHHGPIDAADAAGHRGGGERPPAGQRHGRALARCPTPTRWPLGPWPSSRRSTATSCGWSRWGPRSSSAAGPMSAPRGRSAPSVSPASPAWLPGSAESKR